MKIVVDTNVVISGKNTTGRLKLSPSCHTNRGDVIRTRDLHVPNVALYQTEPRPEWLLTIGNGNLIMHKSQIILRKSVSESLTK